MANYNAMAGSQYRRRPQVGHPRIRDPDTRPLPDMARHRAMAKNKPIGSDASIWGMRSTSFATGSLTRPTEKSASA